MTYCMPHGVPDAMTVAGIPFKILQMPGVTVLLFEEFHKYRQIHTDGRQLLRSALFQAPGFLLFQVDGKVRCECNTVNLPFPFSSKRKERKAGWRRSGNQ